jgi:drug/metabolite transporter (DMT)-like permease
VNSTAFGLCLAGFSALTTALAHASLKAGADKLAVQAWVRLVGLAVAAPLALWIGLPPAYLWPWLVAAAVTHAVYQATLTFSYTATDFSVAYPIARGVAPILTAAAGVLLLGDAFGGTLIIAIATVSVGIVTLAAGGRLSRAGLFAAVGTGILTAAYSVIDARGMRMSPGLFTFIAWFFVLDGFAMPLFFAWRRRSDAVAAMRADWRPGLSAAIMAPVSFVPALFAFSLAPVGAVAAIREASVLVGMAVAGRVLGERVDARRLIGAALVTIGIIGIIAVAPRA